MPFDVVSFGAGKKSGGGGGSGDIKTQPLNVSENGTYTAPSGRAYTPVNVNVKQPDEYGGQYEITPSNQSQTLTTADKKLTDDITVYPIPNEYIIPKGTLSIDENGSHDVAQYESVDVDVEPVLQKREIDVIENGQQIVNPDSDYDGLSEVIVNVVVPEIEVNPLHVTENGAYTPTTGTAYGPVTVNVPGNIETEELEVTQNGTYTAPDGKAYNPVKVNVSEADEYSGPYQVESSVSRDQIIETNGKIMSQNFIINRVYVSEVTNLADGYTVTIGRQNNFPDIRRTKYIATMNHNPIKILGVSEG